MMCPICTVETQTEHTDDDCVKAVIDSGLFRAYPFPRKVPSVDKWTEQERAFAEQFSLQVIRWKKAELQNDQM